MTVAKNHNSQLGYRRTTAETLVSAELAESFNGLPKGMIKTKMLRLVDQYTNLRQLKPNAVRLLKELLETVPPAALKIEGEYDPFDYEDRKPLTVFKSNKRLAHSLQIQVRSVSRLLRELHELHFISFIDSDDRSRGTREGVVYGIDVRPTLAQLQEMSAQIEAADLAFSHRRAVHKALANLRVEILSMFESLEPAVQGAATRWADTIRLASREDDVDVLSALFEKAAAFREELKGAVRGQIFALNESCADDSPDAHITNKPNKIEDSVLAIRKDGEVQKPVASPVSRRPRKRPVSRDIIPAEDLVRANMEKLLPEIGVDAGAYATLGHEAFIEMHARSLRSEIKLSTSAGQALQSRWGPLGYYLVLLLAAKKTDIRSRAGYARSFITDGCHYDLRPSFMGLVKHYVHEPFLGTQG